jgi:uncharacterized protein
LTKSKKLRVLREIYASIPSPGCKGLCADACTTIPVFPIEREQLEQAAGRRLPSIPAPGTDDIGAATLMGDEVGAPCPLLVMGRCSAYEQRPLICRAFGSVEGLRCPHGCRPAELVTDEEQLAYFEKVADL